MQAVTGYAVSIEKNLKKWQNMENQNNPHDKLDCPIHPCHYVRDNMIKCLGKKGFIAINSSPEYREAFKLCAIYRDHIETMFRHTKHDRK